VKVTSSRGTTATVISGMVSLAITISPLRMGRKPAQTYSEWPVPLPNCQAPVTR